MVLVEEEHALGELIDVVMAEGGAGALGLVGGQLLLELVDVLRERRDDRGFVDPR